MNSVGIKKSDNTGTIQWSDSVDIVEVDFPNEDTKKVVEDYLKTKKKFNIPQSDDIDDYIEIEARPDESSDFMRLGLCTLYAKTGVFVDWNVNE